MHAVSTQTTHNTAETQFVEAAGVEFAYRRFGRSSGLPLVMLQHFRGNLDNWDPALTDTLAAEREVILVDYPGVGSSRGAFGPTIADTARHMSRSSARSTSTRSTSSGSRSAGSSRRRSPWSGRRSFDG